jgi:glucose/mannose transport system permease protein
MKQIKKEYLLSIIVLSLSIVLVGIFVYGFIFNTVYVSLTDWGAKKGLSLTPDIKVIGFANYADLFSGIIDFRFRQDLINAVYYSLFLVAGCLIAGMGLAILLDRYPRGEGFFRTLFLFPMALSFIVTGTIWRWLLAPDGGLNILPKILFGLPKSNFLWLSDRTAVLKFNWQFFPAVLGFILFIIFLIITIKNRKHTKQVRFWIFAGLSFLSLVYSLFLYRLHPPTLPFEEQHGFNLATIGIIIAGIWQYSGYTMAIFLAGLRSIPVEIYEASKIDGAGNATYYFKVAIPNLWPMMISAIIILSHISLKLFDLIFAMAGTDNSATGHPSITMYLTTFRANNFAKGAAISVILFLLASLFIIPYLTYNYGKKR